MTIDDFVVASNSTDSVDELLMLFKQAMEHLGFDQVLFTLLNRHDALSEDAQFALFHNYPAHWADHYLASDYDEIDPVRMLMEHQQVPFSWCEILLEKTLSKQQRGLFREAREAGLHRGVGIPLRGPGGALAGMAAACSEESEGRLPDSLERAYLLANQFYVCFWRLKQTGSPPSPELTIKETELLQWAAVGLTRADIAGRMGVSAHTVDFHCRNVLRKLDVPNVTAAVARALTRGLICP